MRVEFLSELRVTPVSEEDWMLLAPFRVRVTDESRLVLFGADVVIYVAPRGFTTDFASVPRLPMAFLLAGGTATKSAVLHDYLYRTGMASRARADAIFAAAMRTEGVPGWRRGLMWSAVRLFGRRAYGRRVAA